MLLALIVAVAAGLFVVERIWPASQLPKAHNWWARVVFINAIQIGIIILAGYTWNDWLQAFSIFRLRDHVGDISQGLDLFQSGPDRGSVRCPIT
jgi:hypothetical protein